MLGNGELGYDPTNKTAKIGDGSTQWDSLDPFNTTTVIDNLTSTSTSAALSANQGRILNNSITSNSSAISTNATNINTNRLNITTLQNKTSDLNVNDITTMKSDINNRVRHDEVVNNLTSTSTSAPLSANQGKILNERLTYIEEHEMIGRDERVGDLDDLTTQDKSNIVSAINEINNLAVLHDPILTLDKNSVTLKGDEEQVITCSHRGNGAITAVSSAPSIVSAVVSGDTVTLKCLSVREASSVTVTISLAATASYMDDEVTVSVAVPKGLTLEEYSWSDIQAIGAAGTGSNYFDIGDSKTVKLNGTVGTLSLNNYQCKVFIIHFNYRNDNGIYFQGFKDTNGIDVALCDSNYSIASSDGTKYFNLNHWGQDGSPYNMNYGGWKGCDARYDILGSTDKAPSGYGAMKTTGCVGYDAMSTAKTNPVANTLMAALPADLRAVLAAWTIYTDNTGNSSNSSANVTTSVDYLPLLSEFEVRGARNYANQYEQNSQTQMTYYLNGNSKVKNKFSDTNNPCLWWVRSPYYYGASSFCNVATGGSANYSDSRWSYGLAPVFRVA